MRTIIAGTDFTPSSLNACLYAAMLAKKLDCKLTIFNLFDVPVVHSNSGLFFISFASQKKHSEEKMKKFAQKISAVHKGVIIEPFLTSGSFKLEVEGFIAKHRVEAVVMGLATRTKISRYIYGSHSTDIAGRIKAPVIIVPERYKKHNIKTVLLSVDNNEKLYHSTLTELERFAADSKTKIKVLSVRTEDELFVPKQQELKFNGVTVKLNTIKSKEIETGIVSFCRKNKADLIAIISKKHSALYNFFAETHTKKIAFASKVPVMAIHE
ncbi:MAG: universal stress protein [Bacteroidia bacterium]|nr:universal stress protein [Bacteroidia bacterium]